VLLDMLEDSEHRPAPHCTNQLDMRWARRDRFQAAPYLLPSIPLKICVQSGLAVHV
jgi:hypothetical protein